MPISAGLFAPEFSLSDETGTVRRLADFRGQTVILYFYPKDDTPGCTTEACNFRDDYSAYEKAGVVILASARMIPNRTQNSNKNSSFHFPCWPISTMPSARLTRFGGRRVLWDAATWAPFAQPS